MKRLIIILLFCSVCFGFTPTLNSFNTGQVSPHVEPRTDFKKYGSANRTVENMFPTIQGPVMRRPGTRFVATVPGSFDYDIELYVSYNPAVSNKAISSYDTAQTLDTSWATSGYYIFAEGTWLFHFLLPTSDGGLIFGHVVDSTNTTDTYAGSFNGVSGTLVIGNEITAAGRGTAIIVAINYASATKGVLYYDSLVGDKFINNDVVTSGGNNVTLNGSENDSIITKLDSDGVIDTTWGDNGHMTMATRNPISAVEDSSGNLYVGVWSPGQEHLIKLNSSGVIQWSFSLDDSGAISNPIVYSLIMLGNRLIMGIPSDTDANFNALVAIDVSDGTIDTTWGTDGFALALSSGVPAYSLRKDSSNNLYAHFLSDDNQTNKNSVAKFDVDGTLDTSWGINGFSGLGQRPVVDSKFSWNNTMAFAGGVLHTITHPHTTGSGYDRTIVYVNKYDSSGTETRLKTVTGFGNDPIKSIVAGGGILYLGGPSIDLESDGSSSVHFYDYDLVYNDKLADTAAVVNIVPISTAPDGVSFTADNDVIRLIAFEHSTDDTYVIEVGNQYMRFYRDDGL